MKEVFTLLLVKVATRLALNIVFNLRKLDFAVDNLQQVHSALAHIVYLEQLVAIVLCQLHIRANKVDKEYGVRNVIDRKRSLLRAWTVVQL